MTSSRATGVVVWLGAALVVGIVASVVSSPRVRRDLAATRDRLEETAEQRMRDLQERLRTRLGGPTALEQMQQTADSATTQWESSMIVSKVAAALAEEPELHGQKVGVRMIGGILHLEGEVQSEEQKMLAARVARRASGAELVANDLRVALHSA